MSRKKQKRLDEVETFPNVFGSSFEMKGKWRDGYFKNDGEVILELACGWGYYTLALAEKFPGKNFIGIDKKGDRIWKGAKMALEGGLKNVAFMRILIEKLDQFFEKGEVDEIWITFPDPHSKPCRANKRLTSPRFLEIYKKVLKDGGNLNFKTDNDNLFDYSMEVFREREYKILDLDEDVHGKDDVPELLQIMTYYEKKFMKLGAKIKYVRLEI